MSTDRKCIQCGHDDIDREGVCKFQFLHPKHLYGSYPVHYCGCHCEFPPDQPTHEFRPAFGDANYCCHEVKGEMCGMIAEADVHQVAPDSQVGCASHGFKFQEGCDACSTAEPRLLPAGSPQDLTLHIVVECLKDRAVRQVVTELLRVDLATSQPSVALDATVSTDKATARPWRVGAPRFQCTMDHFPHGRGQCVYLFQEFTDSPTEIYQDKEYVTLTENGDGLVVGQWDYDYGGVKRIADAELIVEAVNSYDSMKAEIEALREVIEMEAVARAVQAGLGASEWKAFLSERAIAVLKF